MRVGGDQPEQHCDVVGVQLEASDGLGHRVTCRLRVLHQLTNLCPVNLISKCTSHHQYGFVNLYKPTVNAA